MDISLMTAQIQPVAGPSEEKLAAPDALAFENELQEAMAPPGVQAPPPPTGVEGAMRTEADPQPNADDQTLDQPQNALSLEANLAAMLWQTVAPTVAPAPITTDAPVIADAVIPPVDPKSALRTPDEASKDSEVVDADLAVVEAATTITEVPEIAAKPIIAVPEQMMVKADSSDEELESTDDVSVESIEVEESRPNEAPKPAQEQIQFKPHQLDRAAKTLDAVVEARQPIQAEGSIRSASIKMTLVTEAFGNLNVSIKSFGASLEADVETRHQDLNQALNVHRPDLIQSIESKGMTLQQFDVRQQMSDQGQPNQSNNPQDQAATQEDLERMARLNFATAESKPVSRPTIGLVNTLA